MNNAEFLKVYKGTPYSSNWRDIKESVRRHVENKKKDANR